MTRVSLPHEHGGYLTSLGAALAGIALAPSPTPAVGVGIAVVAAFFARGAIDRLATRKPLAAWDPAALALLAALVAGGCLLVAARDPAWAAATLSLCAAILVASVAARRARRQRDVRFEAIGMSALGASVGLAALAAGASASKAAAAAIVLAVHAGVAVPLVRTEVRARERGLAGRAVVLAAVVLLAAAAAVTALVGPLVMFALLPRALHVADRAIARRAPWPAPLVGWRETAALLACVIFLVLTLS